MTVLHSWAMALGVVGIGLPVLIHWMTRPRPVRLPLSTLRFVQEVVHQRRALHRLRDLLILLIRGAAVLLIGWAFARPLIGQRPLVSSSDTGETSRVIVLDVSQSMAAKVHGIETLERARSLAAKHLRQRTGLHANLILAGARPRPVFERLSTNFSALRGELADVRPLPERLNIQAVLALAAQMLAEAPDTAQTPDTAQAPGTAARRRELVLISDLQRSNWGEADFSVLPDDTLIQLESAAPEQTPANLALLRVGCKRRVEQGQPFRLEVEVGNYSPTPRQVQIKVEMGESSYLLEGLCPAGSTTTLSADVVLHSAGWRAGQARLLGVEDALTADNVRSFALDVRSKPTYGLITREPGEPQASSSYFLERGLVPLRSRDEPATARVIRIAPAQVNRENLASADLIVLDHPGTLSREAIHLVTALMRRGREVLYVTAESIDATNLRWIAEVAGSDLQMPAEFNPPPAGQMRHGLFLADVRGKEPPFSVFGDNLSAVIDPLRFSGGLDSRMVETGLQEDVLAVLNDRSAFLVVTACGSGSLAVLNADLGRSNFPRSPVFVPLLAELTDRLLAQRQDKQTIACGESVAVYLPAGTGGMADLKIVGPDMSGQAIGTLSEESTGILWRWNRAGAPGVYRVEREDKVVLALATGIPAEESDLRTLPSSALEKRLAGGRKVHYRAASSDEDTQDDAWTWFAVACVGCLLMELLGLKAFRT